MFPHSFIGFMIHFFSYRETEKVLNGFVIVKHSQNYQCCTKTSSSTTKLKPAILEQKFLEKNNDAQNHLRSL